MIDAVEPNFAGEFRHMLEDRTLGPYADVVRSSLASRPVDLATLFDRGMDSLMRLEHRPDESLAAYFLVLSSLKGIRGDTKDVAIDAMVFCRHEDDFPVPSQRKAILARYQTLRPTLIENRTQ